MKMNRSNSNGTLKQAVIEAATETAGEEKRTKNEWYGEECRGAIREKIEDRLHMLQRNNKTNI
jgi:hypothetical protein